MLPFAPVDVGDKMIPAVILIVCLRRSGYVLRYVEYLYTSRQPIAFKKLYPCCLDWFLN